LKGMLKFFGSVVFFFLPLNRKSTNILKKKPPKAFCKLTVALSWFINLKGFKNLSGLGLPDNQPLVDII
jgi:hypothetical protein